MFPTYLRISKFIYQSPFDFYTSNISFHAVLRAFTITGKLRPEEVVQAALSSLPDEVVDTVGVTSLPSEDSVSERRRKLDFLEMQEELIKVDKNLFCLGIAVYLVSISLSYILLLIFLYLTVYRKRKRKRKRN